MTKEDIRKQVLSIIADDLSIGAEIREDVSLLEDGTMDSMDWVAFLSRIEEVYGIEIPAEEANRHQIARLANLLAYLEEKVR